MNDRNAVAGLDLRAPFALNVRPMSWRLDYELQLLEPLTEHQLSLADGYGPKLSGGSTGFALTGTLGEKRIHGTTQFRGDSRTPDDVLQILIALKKAELDFSGHAWATGLFAHDERLKVDKLDLEDVQRKLLAMWGSVPPAPGAEPEAETESEEEDDERLPAREPRGPSKKVEKWLASARADFELWKKSKGEG